MQHRGLSLLALILLLAGPAALGLRAYPLQVSLNSVGNAAVSFSGPSDSFSFRNSTLPGSGGYGFVITSGSSADLVGLLGNISGTYSIGPVAANGNTQSAPVSGAGTFAISDGVSTLTALLNWNDIQTQTPMSPGSAAFANTVAVMNLSGFRYSGSNAALRQLASSSGGTLAASINFSPTRDLKQLTKQLSNAAPYSADLSVVPEPSFYWLIALGMSGLLGLRRSGRT